MGGTLSRQRVGDAEVEIEVRRSARRRRTVTARREGERVVVLMPAGLTPEQERHHIETLVGRLQRRGGTRGTGDAALLARARTLAARYLPGDVRPASVRWVSNQQRRWGSCSTRTGDIRLSDRMRGFPQYVIDDVLVHELAHLVHADHGPAFRALTARHPPHERAAAFLLGYEHGRRDGAPGGRPGLDDSGVLDDLEDTRDLGDPPPTDERGVPTLL